MLFKDAGGGGSAISSNTAVMESENENINDSLEVIVGEYDTYSDTNDTLRSTWEGDLKEIYDIYIKYTENAYNDTVKIIKIYTEKVEQFNLQSKEINGNAEILANVGG